MNIGEILRSGNVQRFHAIPGLNTQSIANHSWGVAMLIQELLPDCRKELILAALTHDCAELVTGDIPATAKWNKPELRDMLEDIERTTEREWGINFELTADEKKLLKLCDCLEGMFYCLHQRFRGNVYAVKPFLEWRKYVKANFALWKNEQEIFDDLIITMEEITNGS